MNPKDVVKIWEDVRQRDPDEKVEWLLRLERNPSPESIEILLDALKQESWFLRDQAARILAGLGELVVDSLIEYLNSGLWYTRSAAAFALGRMGLPVAAAPLAVLLRDPNRTVRDAACDALVLICGNQMGSFAVALALLGLPERAQRFALDGLGFRNPDIAEQIAVLLQDPSLTDIAERRQLARAVNDEGFRWEDVVGGDDAEQRLG